MNEHVGSNNTGLAPGCPVCGNTLTVRLAKSKKTGRPFIMLICDSDGRHFRGFIADRNYIQQVFGQIEVKTQTEPNGC